MWNAYKKFRYALSYDLHYGEMDDYFVFSAQLNTNKVFVLSVLLAAIRLIMQPW